MVIKLTYSTYNIAYGFTGGSVVKNLPANEGVSDSILRSGRSSGEENGNSLQYSCLGNPPPPWMEEPGGLHFMGLQELDMI